ncbi:unnamed protein product [Larinioides sclopetarius]|uniref:Zinc transporter 2 n=1 Tax=Larinioides sclopetarius TaxID=280406 RepID=A0AAV2BIZ7_9ARAC
MENSKKGEKIPLTLSGEHKMGTYESLVSRDNSIIYCCHGNAADECCQNGTSDSSENGKPFMKRESILSETHCHDDNEVGIDKVARRKLLFASLLCLLFMIGEAVGGILANSLAIATDAAHLLTDFASFMISLMAIWVASRPATKRMSFGWYRAEVIGALTSVLLIWVVTGVLVYMAVQRIINEDYNIDAEIMLITAAVGVGVNVIMGIALQAGGVSHGHSHGGDTPKHGHSHSGAGRDNINVRAAFIHVVGDFIQSLGVLIAAFVIYYRKDYAIVDPICTFFFSVLVLFTTFAILRETLNVLMEGSPRGMNFQEVMKLIYTIPGVAKVHNLRIWSLSMDKTALSAHIVVAKGENPITILKKASGIIRKELGVFDLTLQVEEYREDMQDCNKCKEPKD